MTGHGAMVSNWKRTGLHWILKKNFSLWGWRWTGMGCQRSCGCPVTGNIQGQVGPSFEHPALVRGVSAHGSGAGLGDL